MSEDITYCAYNCKNTKCKRNSKNIKQFNIPHSFAYFHDCNKYPPMEFPEEQLLRRKKNDTRRNNQTR